ncbi:PIN domain-containing protein [Sulfitobacter sp. D35]|uniref:RSP_2648 family PIN domain-containing protein n=1 Tax=Sulfitobacter sp. D35 TaxID=3083252 RepID=UPI00296F4E0A|nr:PIN domain-containing protein [Sulfitobacter sp. D35]MDW4497691.1 PIN domain-containing protein [Sulfitobacter sp. D35]
MRIVLDACVLYPTVMRQVILGAARATGAFEPVWSARILEEWARAAEKLGPEGAAQARGEIVLLRADWPDAERRPEPGIEARLWLPDPADVHVLAVAVGSSADAIMTLNAKDFPRGTLAEEGLVRIDPDALLSSLAQEHVEAMRTVGAEILAEARRLSGEDWTLRGLMKKARLPRLGKQLDRP